jgi:hypothetical protein
MPNYRVIAIPTNTADKIRSTMKAPGYGHPAHREVAAGYGPCRHCLQEFRVGQEERILFTLDPFYGMEPFPLPGPVFIHADPCMRYSESSGFPAATRKHGLTLIAYGVGREQVEEHRVTDADLDQCIEQLFLLPSVRYIHVRDTDAGCYDFRIER